MVWYRLQITVVCAREQKVAAEDTVLYSVEVRPLSLNSLCTNPASTEECARQVACFSSEEMESSKQRTAQREKRRTLHPSHTHNASVCICYHVFSQKKRHLSVEWKWLLPRWNIKQVKW